MALKSACLSRHRHLSRHKSHHIKNDLLETFFYILFATIHNDSNSFLFYIFAAIHKMSLLPQITADEYRALLDKFIARGGKPEWTTLLTERKTHAKSLLLLTPVDNSYVLTFETRSIVRVISDEVLAMAALADVELRKEGLVFYMLQKNHWFNEFPYGNCTPEKLQLIHNYIETLANPHVNFFCVRYKVLIIEDSRVFLPNEPARIFVCYGTGKEPVGFNYQFEIYFALLLRLLEPDVTDEQVVDIFCNQLTNELTEHTNQLQMDVHLVDRIRDIFNTNPALVNLAINTHLSKLLNMQNPQAGFELACMTASMLKQIVPCEITALSPGQMMMFERMQQ